MDFPEHCKKSQGVGRRGRGSGEGRADPPVAMEGMGGPSKGQLGPHPHLGALDEAALSNCKYKVHMSHGL